MLCQRATRGTRKAGFFFRIEKWARLHPKPSRGQWDQWWLESNSLESNQLTGGALDEDEDREEARRRHHCSIPARFRRSFLLFFVCFFVFWGGGYLIFGVIRKAIPTSYLFSFFCLFFLTVELGNRRNRFHQCWSLLLLLLLLSLLLLKMICWRKRSSCAMRRPVDVFVKRTTAASAT